MLFVSLIYLDVQLDTEHIRDALGALITSASAQTLGEAYWQPYLLLREIQKYHDNSASARAGV